MEGGRQRGAVERRRRNSAPSSFHLPPSSFLFLDLVAVPDFRPGPRAAFEARTLFLLASWREHGGARCPLHLACVGEPPRSVAGLAERVGATASVHPPFPLGETRCANKLRGFEAPVVSGRRLLVDADVLVLNDPAAALTGLPANVLAAAPATVPRVPAALWAEIYAALEVPFPAERIRSVTGELGLRHDADGFPPDPMPPYFNGGVLLVPGACPLRERWEDHLRRIPARFAARTTGWPESERRAVIQSDQAALATALASLRGEGWTFATLPPAAHARRVHFRGGALRVDEVAVLHAIGMFKGLTECTVPAVEASLETWLARWQDAIREGRPADAERECRQAAELVNDLWRKHVRPALGGG